MWTIIKSIVTDIKKNKEKEIYQSICLVRSYTFNEIVLLIKRVNKNLSKVRTQSPQRVFRFHFDLSIDNISNLNAIWIIKLQ